MIRKLILMLFGLLQVCFVSAQSWIRINQLGYLPESVKVAVFISAGSQKVLEFTIHDAVTDKEVFRNKAVWFSGEDWGMKSAALLNFTDFTKQGGYYISLNGT